LALLLEQLHELGVSEPLPEPVTEASEDETLRQEIAQAKQAARAEGASGQRPRRQSWQAQADVERRVHHVEVSAAERICAHCGREQQRIGNDITRKLEYVPAHFIEHEYRLDKYACGRCKQGVTTATGPARVIKGSAVDASVLAQVTVSKYADHIPLERQRRIYNRDGVAIAVSTINPSRCSVRVSAPALAASERPRARRPAAFTVSCA
jgi:transposase